jgi:hypothetical protein
MPVVPLTGDIGPCQKVAAAGSLPGKRKTLERAHGDGAADRRPGGTGQPGQ